MDNSRLCALAQCLYPYLKGPHGLFFSATCTTLYARKPPATNVPWCVSLDQDDVFAAGSKPGEWDRAMIKWIIWPYRVSLLAFWARWGLQKDRAVYPWYAEYRNMKTEDLREYLKCNWRLMSPSAISMGIVELCRRHLDPREWLGFDRIILGKAYKRGTQLFFLVGDEVAFGQLYKYAPVRLYLPTVYIWDSISMLIKYPRVVNIENLMDCPDTLEEFIDGIHEDDLRYVMKQQTVGTILTILELCDGLQEVKSTRGFSTREILINEAFLRALGSCGLPELKRVLSLGPTNMVAAARCASYNWVMWLAVNGYLKGCVDQIFLNAAKEGCGEHLYLIPYLERPQETIKAIEDLGNPNNELLLETMRVIWL